LGENVQADGIAEAVVYIARTQVPDALQVKAAIGLSGRSYVRPRGRVLRRLLRNRASIVGLIALILMALLAILAPFLSVDPVEQNLSGKLLPPSVRHPLGTDDLGRDVFSRLAHGGRISMILGFTIIAIAGVSGTVLGLIGGYFGGTLDMIVMRLADMFLAFPKLILAMALAAALGPSLQNAMVAISLTWWPEYARLCRSVVLAVRESEYIAAARALGASTARILSRHVFPNSVGPVIVKATMDVGFAILYASGLSFIGFGAQPPTPEWGAMVADGRNYVYTAWWVATAPGLAILVTTMAFNLVGDSLRDVFDPREHAS
jgi:peptide/nickel transport system permease protein